MSYILDALKKVEHEKTRKAKAGGITSISGDLFLERVKSPPSGIARKVIVVIALVLLVAGAAAWLLLKDDKRKAAVAPASPAAPAASVPALRPGVPASATAPSPPPVQTAAPGLPASTVSPSTVVQQPAASAPIAPERAAKSEKKAAEKKPAPPPPPQPTVRTVPPPADIKLSGIAWQEERSARRVVINGFLLHEGSTVSGAKILEIHQDRVRFGTPAGIFDLRMDAATTPVAPK